MLPYQFKIPGVILSLTGSVMGILFFTIDLRFEIPVLAVVSTYMETGFFRVFKTNFADETILILLIAGLFLIAFSREKTEYDGLEILRIRALRKTAVTVTGLLLFSVIFIYGSGFIAVLVLNTVLPFIVYLTFFYSMKYRYLNGSFPAGK